MMEFSRMIEKLRSSNALKQEQKEQFGRDPKVVVNILYDTQRKDIGVLLRLNNLHKRISLVKYIVGEWKPTQKKY